jgi:hypothetical protein
MIILSAIFISLLAYLINVSLTPHFGLSLSHIILVLPFISLYSLRDKTIFPYILSAIVGILYDGSAVSGFPVFSVTFILITLIGKNVFSKITSYGVERTGLYLTVIGYFLILFSDWGRLIANYSDITLYVDIVISLALLVVIQIMLFRVFKNYFEWVEKTTTERYR